MKKKDKLEFFIPKKENGIGQWLAEEGISAGFPSPADDFKETRISLDRELVKNKEATFYARVSGDSMIGAGLDDGDLLVIDRSKNPENGKMVVIEMNPRVSRSSALASKATGFPIAKVAALLSVGFTLDELKNDITGGLTPASFEPSIDYIVTKIPKFAFEKFPQANSRLTTQMKSVGEVMAIGGNFQESLQKAICSMEEDLDGFNSVIDTENSDSENELKYQL